MTVRRSPRRALVALLVGAALVLVAGCGSGPSVGGTVEWRELTVDLPDGWRELDRTSTSLSLGDGEGSATPGERGDLLVFTEISVRPGMSPDDWRAFVDEVDGTLEEDTTTTVGSLPATQLQFSFTTNGIPTRERVVLIPSRELMLLQQPVPMQGDTEAPTWFDEHVDEFDALLDGITFGAPGDYLEDD